MTADARIEQLRRMKREVLEDGGPERVAARRKRGEKTARERMLELLDPGTFVELDKFVTLHSAGSGTKGTSTAEEGVATGCGKIAGRDVYVFSQGRVVPGGSLDDMFARKITKIVDLALKNGAPLIGLHDMGTVRDQAGAVPLGGFADIVFRNVMASGVVPQISAILGPCAGGSVFSPAMADFVIMVKGTSQMFVTDPQLILDGTGQAVTFEELGGAATHSSRSGVAHLTADDEAHCLGVIRRLLAYLPQNNLEEVPRLHCDDPVDRMDERLDSLLPTDQNARYDMREVLSRVVDHGDFFEIQPGWAQNLLVGFARLGGRSVGVVANQPSHLNGALDIDASVKGARFVRFCDAFNIPLVTFVDAPGFLPQVEQEHGGIIRNGAKLLYAFCEATVPKLTVVVGKAYGEAYETMCSKHVGADFSLAWPSADVAAAAPGKSAGRGTRSAEAADGPRDTLASAYVAAQRGHIDDIIEPRETRPRLIASLEASVSKRGGRPPKKHGTMPL